MNDVPHALPVEAIEVDTACLHCDNFRGLYGDGLDPDCKQAIRSDAGSLPADQDPAGMPVPHRTAGSA